MKREILMTTTASETRVAIIEDGSLVELMVDRPDAERMVGDIYLGKVEAVLPGIQAAFVDIGTDKAGFLHVSDAVTEDDDEDDDEDSSGGGRRRSRRDLPPIQDILKKGQEVLVQVTKEPISTKGPRLTAHVSLPGRFLVYMPLSDHVGVSRKIEDRGERARLRELAREVMPKNAGGAIIRTVGEELTEETFKREFDSLHGTWKQIRRRSSRGKAPRAVHREAKLTAGIIRDLFSEKVDSLTIDGPEVYREVEQYLETVDPSLKSRVHLYEEPVSLFDRYEIESEITAAFQRKVDLPSGGHIVIEPTEALVSIDVNTGRYTGKKDPEKTILKTNVDAAKEIARQLRLRDIGGIVVCDFIDMESQSNRDRVLQELRTHLGRDRARTRAFEISELGLIEMTRQRVRPSLYQLQTTPCLACGGTGRIFTPETVVRRIERAVRRVAAEDKEREIMIRLHPEVALYVLEQEQGLLKRLEADTKVQVNLRDDPLMQQDGFRIVAAGGAGPDVTHHYTVT